MRDHPDAARIAHLLRRCTFGPAPGDVQRGIDEGYETLRERLLAEDRPGLPNGDADLPAARENWREALEEAWTHLMFDPSRLLHAKLTWFWSTHFTTSPRKVHPALIFRQLSLLNRHAFGNFREMTEVITVDPAMLMFLDGDRSKAEDPNENHARELMELFCLGHGAAYTEADVRAGAQALAGWVVDRDDLRAREASGARISLSDPIRATVDPERANSAEVGFLGRPVVNSDDVLATVLDHPDCAPFVVGELYTFFVGVPPSDAERADLAAGFLASGMEIRPLMGEIIRSDAFENSEYARPRYPVEWYPAAKRAATDGRIDPLGDIPWYPFNKLGQQPSNPPNVSGWPAGAPWVSASQQILRAQVTQALGLGDLEPPDDPVKGVLDRCSLVTVSDSTLDTLTDAAQNLPEWQVMRVLMTLALTSPEFALA